ncbi:MAG TPA: GatB/YqeY domain-containing protein [Solirubrobacteraceae bacterium]|nr:GatB/YqeY domain-containing protein [Solirubrobacteraceae bacterium]
MSVQQQLKSDLSTAMKAGDKERVGALRMVLSELQKDAKLGGGDELAVLRRERKRRLEAADAYREAGRAGLADGEEREAQLIAGYLPAELSDEQLREIVAQAVKDSGAESVRDMGRAMGMAMSAADGRADGKRVSGMVRAALGG